MSYNIIPTPTFQKDVKSLQKKYRHIVADLEELESILSENPFAGDAIKGLEKTIFKIRLASTDMGKGKSGGFRIIYYLVSADQTIYLLTLYAKAYKQSISTSEIKSILKTCGLP